MSSCSRLRRTFVFAVAIVGFSLAVTASAFCQHYTQTNLTVDQNSTASAPNQDPNLVNAWGLTRSSTSFWWISDNGTGVSTLYDGTGKPQPQPEPLVVKIPLPKGQSGTAAPTGTVFNFTKGFEVAPGKPAVFLFVTEDGTISGWNPGVDRTNAVLLKDRSGKAIYKGCAIAQTPRGPRFFATNFMTGKVEVFDAKFHRLKFDEDRFTFRGLSDDYAAFNIQNVGGNLVVTFANRAPGSTDENHGPGLGLVGVFSPRGRLLLRLQHGRWFNAPWGVALAPSDFGVFSHEFLIGNFGDGTIHAFNSVTGRFDGTVLTSGDQALTIDGLWALQFGGGDLTNSGSATQLFFTAGPGDEKHGLFGKISPAPDEQRGSSE
jgi:uncharacterized protein (TIGR03118 family)